MKEISYSNILKDKSIIGEIAILTKTPKPFGERHKYILITSSKLESFGYRACISEKISSGFALPAFIPICESDYKNLYDGDIVKVNEHSLTVLWESQTNDNALMLTESCNCKCIMCPQPTKAHDPKYISEIHTILDLLKGRNLSSICITGGEPTLIKSDFIKILSRCTKEHSEAEINILTNGKTFADINFAKEVSAVSNEKTIFCVSLHSDIDYINDEIVGVKHSRDKTEHGIYNLAQSGQKIEIRHVITKKNYTRLPQFAEYLYSYFPFCSHYAFMGMEVHGDAERNKDEIYIPPLEYAEELRRAILKLYNRGLPASVYNIPLCMCHEEIRKFATQSISQWKNIFHESCSLCFRKNSCAGFFTTSTIIPHEDIKPIITD